MRQPELPLYFGPYSFDSHTGQLWRGTLEVRLTPKALAVLHVFVTRPGQVVTKDEFFQAVWSDTVVSDDALTSCIQELRQALHDNARKPRFIETVHRRGYRFLPATTLLPFRGRVFKLPDASQEFLSVCEIVQAVARAQV
jgi:DNA-binding winged helix-turn-helix (wHTH) protein